MVQGMRWCEHGETVRSGQSDHGCSGCVNGVCGAALACVIPERDAQPARCWIAYPGRFANANAKKAFREYWGAEMQGRANRPSLSRRTRNRLLMAAIAGAGVLVCGVADLIHRFF